MESGGTFEPHHDLTHELSDVFLSTPITVGFVFVVFPRNKECYDIYCCSCWMFFFLTSLLSTTQTTSYKTDVAALRAICRRLGGRHLADVWCQHLRYPHCQWRFPVRAVPTAAITSHHHIALCYRTFQYIALLADVQVNLYHCIYIYIIHNVVSWLVARFAIVANKKQIILNPCIVWKVHYCGKKSWEAFFLWKINSVQLLRQTLFLNTTSAKHTTNTNYQ